MQDDKRVVGLVTDRDLAIRVLGPGLDSKSTTLADVMTSPVATLSHTDSQVDAIRLMQERNIRRIPLVEAERIVGIVTLDDLLLDEAAPLEQLAAVVQAQIGDGGPASPLRSPAARRGAARAQATYGCLLNELLAHAHLESPERAETAIEIVATALAVSLLTLFSMTKIWAEAFWNPEPENSVVSRANPSWRIRFCLFGPPIGRAAHRQQVPKWSGTVVDESPLTHAEDDESPTDHHASEGRQTG